MIDTVRYMIAAYVVAGLVLLGYGVRVFRRR